MTGYKMGTIVKMNNVFQNDDTLNTESKNLMCETMIELYQNLLKKQRLELDQCKLVDFSR